MVQLPPSEFTYSKYGRFILSWEVIKTPKNYYEWLLKQNIIGYCNSIECKVRPRKNEMSIMFEDKNGQQGWSHIPIDIWQKYLKQNKLEVKK